MIHRAFLIIAILLALAGPGWGGTDFYVRPADTTNSTALSQYAAARRSAYTTSNDRYAGAFTGFGPPSATVTFSGNVCNSGSAYASSGLPIYFSNSGGALPTRTAAVDTAGDTHVGSGLIDGMATAPTAQIDIGDVVTVSAGFPGGALTVISKTTTSITLNIAATSSETNITTTRAAVPLRSDGWPYYTKYNTGSTVLVSADRGTTTIALDDAGSGTHTIWAGVYWPALTAGDTLYVCAGPSGVGQHGNVGATGSILKFTSATVGTAGITITGDYSAAPSATAQADWATAIAAGLTAPGAIYNTSYLIKAGATWIQDGTYTNVWHYGTSVATVYSMWKMAGGTGNPVMLKRMPIKLSNPPTAAELALFSSPGDWGVDPTTHYPYIYSNTNPNTDTFLTMVGQPAIVASKTNLTLSNLTLRGGYIDLSTYTGTTITNCNIADARYGVALHGAYGNTVVSNLTIDKVGDGIYIIGTGNNSVDLITISACSISNVSKQGNGQGATDNLGIGVMEGNVLVQGNIIDGAAAGVQCYSGGAGGLLTVNVARNWVKNLVRLHQGDPIEGMTAASPIVLTSTTHQQSDGSRVILSGITQANWSSLNGVTYYAKRTGYSSSTFALYSDSGLTSPVSGAGWSAYLPNIDPGVWSAYEPNPINFTGAGIDFVLDNTASGTYSLRAVSNIIQNCPFGTRMIGAYATNQMAAYNNVIDSCNIGMCSVARIAVDYQHVISTLYNNIINRLTNHGSGLPVCFNYAYGPSAGATWTFASDYNDYYPNANTGSKFYYAEGGGFELPLTTWADWRAKISGLDSHTILLNPLFVDPDGGNAAGFKLQPGSPARRKGFPGLRTADFGSRIVPASRDDIGAWYEAVAAARMGMMP